MKKFIKNPKKIITGLIIILIVFLIIRNYNNKKLEASPYNPKKDVLVTPQTENINSKLNLAGSIDAQSKVTLQFQSGGQLSWLGVKVGDRVKKYQAIASLDKTSLKKNLEIQFNNYHSALTNFYDTTDDYKDRVISTEFQRILDRNQNTLNNAVINYELTDLAIKYATLTSPINGIVTDIGPALPGTNIIPTSNTYSIVDPSTIYFKSEIDQEDVNKIKEGQKAQIILDSFENEVIESQIKYISFSPIPGQSSIVYEVRFEFPLNNENLSYKLGMTGNAEIIIQEAQDTSTIPIEAVFEENDKYFVQIYKGKNNILKQEIKIGIESESKYQVLEGLSPYDQVIIKKR